MHRPSIEQLEDRTMLSAVPLDVTMLSNAFTDNVAAEVSFVMSNQENDRIQIANEELVMGVRDSLVSDAEYAPSAEKPLTVTMKARFTNPDSLYVFTRSEGTTAVGGYRSKNEVRAEMDMAGKVLKIFEMQSSGNSVIAQIQNVELPLNQDLDVTLVDDGKTVTVTVGEYTVSGETTGSYSKFKTGISNWSGRTVVDDYVIQHGEETVQQSTEETANPPADTEEADAVFADIASGAWNPFDNNTVEDLAFVLSNHENDRIQVTNEELVMGVRDSIVSEEHYEPTEQQPLDVSFTARFTNLDTLYVFTRSEGSTAVGGYRSSNEVRGIVDMAGKSVALYEVQGGSQRQIASVQNVELPMNEDIQIQITDNGSMVTIHIGELEVTGQTTGSYSSFKTGISNWNGRTVVDDYRIDHQVPQEESGALLNLTQAQIAVSAELTVQLQEEAAILEEELEAESQQLLTSVSVTNTELSRIQGIQLFQRSPFYIHGNDIEPTLQQNLPDIFPENLQEFIQAEALRTNEEPGHVQDRILMQQSDYRGILRDLVGSYETVMSDLLNTTVDMATRVQADPSLEYDLMQELRTNRDSTAGLRYMTEIAFFGIHIPSAEELYREGQRLFTEEQDLLTKIQSEQDRLQTIDSFRASNRAWQLAHGVPDLAVLIGADEGSADNGYEGELSEAQQRRLGRAQRLVETAMSSMLDRRIQMRVVPDNVVIEDRLVYGGNGITYFDVHANEQQTTVQGVLSTIAVNRESRTDAEAGITEGGSSLVSSLPETEVLGASTVILSESAELPVGTNELSQWWATAGEGPMDIDWNVYVDNEGVFRLNIRGFETWDLSNATLVIDGAHEVALEDATRGIQSVDTLGLQAGGHTFTLKQAGVPVEVGVHPGRFTLTKLDELSPIIEADMETLLIADHPEIDVNQMFNISIDGVTEPLQGVQQLIEKFTPTLRFAAGEDFPMPYAIDGYSAPTEGNVNAEIDISESPATPTPTMYASVVQDGDKLAINYHFFYPMSNWSDEGGYNTHEGDWEGITVYLQKNGDSWEKGGIALAQHEKVGSSKGGQYYETWEGTEGSHPTIFVGLGGHASYLDPGIYDVTPIHNEVADGSGNTVWHEDVDVVYLPRTGAENSQILDMLRFSGYWGDKDLEGTEIINNYDGDQAPRGPVFTSNGYELGLRWLDPWTWKKNFEL